MRLPRDDTVAARASGKAQWLRASHVARCVLLLFIASFAQVVKGQQTPQEKLGRQIYLRGSGSAVMGDESMAIAGTALPCASCHGEDGSGRSEGGVVPSDIRWQTLTKPYGLTHESGRSHPAYTESSLRRAITEGIDPAGNRILVAMPRYQMPTSDLSALIAYMRSLGEIHDPGLTSDAIRIGHRSAALRSSGCLGPRHRIHVARVFHRNQSPRWNLRSQARAGGCRCRPGHARDARWLRAAG